MAAKWYQLLSACKLAITCTTVTSAKAMIAIETEAMIAIEKSFSRSTLLYLFAGFVTFA